MSLEAEAARRTERDGIPRSIVNGRIMKYDWELSEETDLDKKELEAHIARLMAEQTN